MDIKKINLCLIFVLTENSSSDLNFSIEASSTGLLLIWLYMPWSATFTDIKVLKCVVCGILQVCKDGEKV